jgi:dienelactone hydrolase
VVNTGGHDYDPFGRGKFPVGVKTIDAPDAGRGRPFPCEIWYPAASEHAGQDLDPEQQDVFTVPPGDKPRRQAAVRGAAAEEGAFPLLIFSHHSGGSRRSATFLCTHLASHGYVVAAIDHSEVVTSELGRQESESADERAARIDGWISSRVPDVTFILDYLLSGAAGQVCAGLDPIRIGIVGHSFGGWTALAAPDVEPRIYAVVALAPGGASRPKPGILAVKLAFDWGRDVPTLLLVGDNDASLPLEGMLEIFERAPGTKQMVILRQADHMHFMDNVEEMHELARTMPASPEFALIQREMAPISELCPGADAHLFVRGLTLCHFDAILKEDEDARRFLVGDIEGQLRGRGVGVRLPDPGAVVGPASKSAT